MILWRLDASEGVLGCAARMNARDRCFPMSISLFSYVDLEFRVPPVTGLIVTRIVARFFSEPTQMGVRMLSADGLSFNADPWKSHGSSIGLAAMPVRPHVVRPCPGIAELLPACAHA